MSSDAARLCRAHLAALGPELDATSLAEVAWLGVQLARRGAAARAEPPGLETGNAQHSRSDTSGSGSMSGSVPASGARTESRGGEAISGKTSVPLFPALDMQGPGADRAALVSVPCGEALPQRLQLERALKPFKRHLPSRRQRELDPLATAEASAEWQSITPVFRPTPERWFDVAILAESSDAMHVWDATLLAMQRMLARHGAFRGVRLWRYALRGDALSLSSAGAALAAPRILIDPQGRRLCCFVTTGTSPLWEHPAWTSVVAALGRHGPTVIVQLMPERTWPYTLLGDAGEDALAQAAGAPTAQLLLRDPFSGMFERARDGLSVPVTSLEPDRLAAWARFVMAPRRLPQPAIRVRAADGAAAGALVAGPDAAPAPAASPRQRIATFRALASPPAFQLLRLLSRMTVTLPVMRLMQIGMRERAQVHLAEVLLSGLIERVTPPGAETAPDLVEYDFAPGIRNELRDSLSSGEREQTDSVLRILEQARRFVETQAGSANDRFQALVRDLLGDRRLASQAQSFLDVSRDFRGLPARLMDSSGEGQGSHASADAGFLSKKAIAHVAGDPGADSLWAGERRCLLLFKTAHQHIWLVASRHSAALVLDDAETRRSARLVQRHDSWLAFLPVRAGENSSGEDVVYFGNGAEPSWYYSRTLFATPGSLEEEVVALAPGGWDGALMQACRLAGEYDALRARMLPGSGRTASLHEVVERMAAAPALDHVDMIQATRHRSPGMRLAAVVWLQGRFDPDLIDWLFECIVGDQAFLAFQAALALHAAVPAMSAQHQTHVRQAALLASEKLHSLGREDSHVHRVLGVIVEYIELDQSLPHPVSKRRVLIGSTAHALTSFRKSTEEAFAARGFEVVSRPPVESAGALEEWTKVLDGCELAVLLVGTSYWAQEKQRWLDDRGVLLAELEYTEALWLSKPVMVFIHEDGASESTPEEDGAPLQRLFRVLADKRNVYRFRSEDMLAQSLKHALDAYTEPEAGNGGETADAYDLETLATEFRRCADRVHALVLREMASSSSQREAEMKETLVERLKRYERNLRERADYLLVDAKRDTGPFFGGMQPKLAFLLSTAVLRMDSPGPLHEMARLAENLRNVADAVTSGKVELIRQAVRDLEKHLNKMRHDTPLPPHRPEQPA